MTNNELPDWWDENEDDGVIGIIADQMQIVEKAQAEIREWFAQSADARDHWREFVEAGGVTARDLERFVDGKTIRRRRGYRQHRHLRIVSKRKRCMNIRREEPNDAA
jgi:hypothetical protein